MANKIRANEERYVIVGYGGKKKGDADEEVKIYYPSLTARMIAATTDVVIFTFILLFISAFLPWKSPQEGVYLLRAVQSGELTDQNEINAALRHFMLEGGGIENIAIQMLSSLFFASVYILPFWFKWAATPGKIVMGMKIVRQDSLEKPSKVQLLIRFLSYPLSLLPPGIGFVWVIFNKRKRSWHDYIAGTVVIYKKKPKVAL
jgi:uncharacterized RDD family membrane protein YckC